MRQTYNPGANHIRIIDYSLPITGADIHYQDLSLDQRDKQTAQPAPTPMEPGQAAGRFAHCARLSRRLKRTVGPIIEDMGVLE